MATTASLDTCKRQVIATLQASQTAWGLTVDYSNAQYSSDTEILSAILQADGDICTAICNTPQHPYQTTFVNTSSALASGASLPARNGMILKVTALDAPVDFTFTSGDVDVAADAIDLQTGSGSANYQLASGVKVRFTTTGTLPPPIVIDTDYYVDFALGIAEVKFCESIYMLQAGTPVEITGAGAGNSTVVVQYEDATQALSKDQILSANSFPNLYGDDFPSTAKFWFIEGDVIYTTSAFAKVLYTDYTLTSTTQAPEPYLPAIVAGAVAMLAKDGSDAGLAQYYQSIYNNMMASIVAMAKVLPDISAYKMAA